MDKGNDDLLFGQPNDLEEAVETLIAYCGEDKLRRIVQAGGDIYASKEVYAIAETIRNHWFLWWHPDHGNKWFPASKPPLLSFFHGVGITHPDDMSDIILSAAWHKLHGRPYDLLDTVDALQEYWKSLCTV